MKFHKTILPNGLRLITVPMKDNPTITVLVMVETGSKYESKKLNGISHFLEHLCFKGTVKRPRPIDISHELDSIGAEYNAFTGHEYTGYYAKADYKHFDKILDVVSDIYLHSTFPKDDIEREKGVIIEEINMYEDMPAEKAEELLASLLYGDQPAGRNIAGTKESVRGISRDDVISYKKKHYVAKATTVVIAGQFDPVRARRQVADIFSVISNSAKSPKIKVIESQTAPGIKIGKKKTDQTHIVFGIRTFGVFHKDQPVLSVLATVLGRGMSSRLFIKMREQLGICYYVRASNHYFTDHGFLSVSAGVDKNRLFEAVSAIVEELKKLRQTKVGEAELAKAKEFISGKLLLNLESSDDVADFYGFQEIIKKQILSPQEHLSQIQKVTAEDIERLAKKIFVNNRINLALVGKATLPKKLASLLRL